MARCRGEGYAMMPEPPPPQYRPPDLPPSGPTPVYDPDDLYGPLRPPQPPVRVRLLKLVAAMALVFGGLIGSFLVARWAGWLEPVQQAARYDTDGQNGIKSTIKYPVEPKPMAVATNGSDPDAEWKRWVRSRLAEHDAKLNDHESRIKALEGQMKGQKPPAQTQPQPQPKPKAYRSMQFVSNKVEDKPADDPDLYVLAPGATKLSFTVESSMNSDVESYWTGTVRTNICDTATGTHLLIPQGSTILGKYRSEKLLFGNERLPTFALTVSLPNGKDVDLGEAPVMDQKGQAGLASRVDQHYWRLVSAIVIMGVLRGGQQALQYQLGVNDPAGAVASGMANSASQVGQMRIGPALNTRPTIYVDAGELGVVILTKKLTLPTYQHLGHGLHGSSCMVASTR
jgi:type IV secretory pathway VirB10-like protein